MEKLIKTLDKTLPTWVDDLFPDVSVKDDKHLISSFVKPAEDKMSLNRFVLHHFLEPTASATAATTASSSSSAAAAAAAATSVVVSAMSSSAALLGGGVKRKRGNPSAALLLLSSSSSSSSSKKQSSHKKNASAAAAAVTENPSEGAASAEPLCEYGDRDDAYHHYKVLHQLQSGNRLTMYDFVEKVNKGTEILLLLPGGGGGGGSGSSGSGGNGSNNNNKSGHHYDAKLRSLLQAAHYKVPVVTRVADAASASTSTSTLEEDSTTSNKQQVFYVFRATLVRVERQAGFFHGVTLARNPPNIILDIPTGRHGGSDHHSTSSSSCLTFNMLKGVHDFQLWSPRLHVDFSHTFSGLVWKKIIAPHGNGQNYAERNRLMACLIQLVADDPIRTAQVCSAARSVQEKITSKKLSNALRSLDTTKSSSTLTLTYTSASTATSKSKASTAVSKAAVATTTTKAAASRSTSNKKQQQQQQPEKIKQQQPSLPAVSGPRKRRASAALLQATAADADAAAPPAAAKKKRAYKQRATTTAAVKSSKSTAVNTKTSTRKKKTAAAAASAAPEMALSSLSSPAEVSIHSSIAANSSCDGMQRLLDAADVADSLDERESSSSSSSSSFEEHDSAALTASPPTPRDEKGEGAATFILEPEPPEPEPPQGEQQQEQYHHPQEGSVEMSLLGLKHKDPLGFLCSVVVDKPISNVTAAAGTGTFADNATSTGGSNVFRN